MARVTRPPPPINDPPPLVNPGYGPAVSTTFVSVSRDMYILSKWGVTYLIGMGETTPLPTFNPATIDISLLRLASATIDISLLPLLRSDFCSRPGFTSYGWVAT